MNLSWASNLSSSSNSLLYRHCGNMNLLAVYACFLTEKIPVFISLNINSPTIGVASFLKPSRVSNRVIDNSCRQKLAFISNILQTLTKEILQVDNRSLSSFSSCIVLWFGVVASYIYIINTIIIHYITRIDYDICVLLLIDQYAILLTIYIAKEYTYEDS